MLGVISALIVGILIAASGATAATVDLAVLGDAGRWNRATKQLKESMERVGVRKLVMPGDNLYSGTYDRAWSPWIIDGFQFPVVAIGNHNSGYANEIAFFGIPSEYYSTAIANTARFIVLNSDNRRNVAAQMAFLDSELTISNEPLVFIVYHHPTYTMTTAHKWTEKRDFQEKIRPLLKRHRSKITAVILGHDHIATMGHYDDLPYVLSGAAQEVRRGAIVDNTQSGTRVKSEWVIGGTPVWIRLQADTLGMVAKFEAMRASDDRILCTAEIQTGRPAKMGADCYR